MTYQNIAMRVLARAGARELTPEEIAEVTGGLPTRAISHDPSGRPVDVTQD